jgi:hypothetical protein
VPAAGRRPGIALGYAVVGAIWALILLAPGRTDFDQIWYAARAVLSGQDPYQLIGPGRASEFPWPFYYPLTAAVLGVPFSALPLSDARHVFVAMGGALIGYIIARHRPQLWPLAFAQPFGNAASTAQWSLFLAGSLVLPWAGIVAAAKPNVGLALLAGARSRRHVLWIVGSMLVLLLVSLVLNPGWPLEWRATLAGAPHFKPLLLRPGGFLMLLALVRWRDPDARLLLALTLIPQTGIWYEAAPALFVLRTLPEAAIIAVLTQTAHLAAGQHPPGFAAESWHIGTLTLWSVLIPSMLIVLRRDLVRRRHDTPEPPDPVASA